ncbi:MAG: DUF1553 domain-containing protein, partial [Verrucomicrobiota bacterium]
AYPDPRLRDVKIDSSSSGRKELAHWITSPYHPQTARVMANRIWLHLFGQGLVTPPNDFGVYGQKPTHPALLDHLASRFRDDLDWSIKALIREIVLSRTYQLDSSPTNLKEDPENRYLTRHLRRRLDAESLRDSILHACGTLDPTPAEGSDIRHLEILVNRAPNLHRPSIHRSVYLCYLRNSPPQELTAFDLPLATKPLAQRNETMLPSQGLFLLNSEFMLSQAQALAHSLSHTLSADEKLSLLWQAVLARTPRTEEREAALALLQQTPESDHPWQVLTQALLASNEFRYVD